jgi:hypothetical protein
VNTFRVEEYDTDKGPVYLKHYASHFAPYRDLPINLLEMGVHRGGSLKMWRDYFRYGQIFGVDLNPPSVDEIERIHMFAGDAGDPKTFENIEAVTGCGVFDIIIDDASHIGSISQRSFATLFDKRLKKGGLYVIEDWGTGYFKDWPDGHVYVPPTQTLDGNDPRYRFHSHDYGMVGWLKGLVDLVGQVDLRVGGGAIDAPPVDSLLIASGIAFLTKSA